MTVATDHKQEAARAQDARRRGDREAALAHFQAAAALAPEQHWILCEIGQELRELGRMDEAEATCAKAAEMEPGMSGAWRGLGWIHRRQGRRAEALAHFQRAFALDPENAWLAFDLAEELREAREDTEAESIYRQALALDNCVGPAWRGLALLARRRNDRDEALENMRRALALSPENIWIKCDTGEDLREMSLLSEAEQTYREVLAVDPRMSGAWRSLALLSRKRGDRLAAWEQFQQALALDPSNPWLKCEAAEDLRELGRLAEADELYRAALAANSDIASGWRGRGMVARRQGRLEAAVEFFAKAATLAPDELSTQREWILALRDLGRWDEAEPLAAALFTRCPNAPLAIMTYAEVNRRQLDAQEIIALFEKAVAATPEDIWPRLSLAEEYFRADRLDEASRAFNQILERDQDQIGALVGKARIARRTGIEGRRGFCSSARVGRRTPTPGPAANSPRKWRTPVSLSKRKTFFET